MKSIIRTVAALTLATAALVPAPAQSQASGLFNALGYGFLGLMTGGAASGSATPDAGAAAAAVGGLLVGALIGHTISSSANRAVAEGRPLGKSHLVAVTAGTVLGAGFLGLIAGNVLLRGEDPGAAGAVGLVGAGLGVYKLGANWGDLTGRDPSDAPSVELKPLALVHGRPGVVLHVRF